MLCHLDGARMLVIYCRQLLREQALAAMVMRRNWRGGGLMGTAIQGKVALVTGAGTGIGESIAVALSEEGASVVLVDVDFSGIQRVSEYVRKSSPASTAFKTDVSNSAEVAKLVDEVIAEFHRIDIIVNNAGICPRTNFLDIAEEEWDRVMEVNLKSAFMLSQKFFPYMVKQKYGRIINIGSAAGKIGGLQVGAHYSASKAAMDCLTKTLALNGAVAGINSNSVCPGVIETEMTNCISEEKIVSYRNAIPVGRLGTPEDVAGVVVFLCSKLADYITGASINVNGGFMMA